jgi:triosephosphate isomerase
MRKVVFGGNWKMHGTWKQTEDYLQHFVNCPLPTNCEIILFVPFPYLNLMQKSLSGSNIRIGAQNMHSEDKGAFTGEVSAEMLLDMGCTHVLVGHSERRSLFLEQGKFLNAKVKKALSKGLIPMYCIGETLAERESQNTALVLQTQIREGLEGLSHDEIARMYFAYEPVWAIGTGVNASEEDARQGISVVREAIAAMSSSRISEAVPIVYGGSVKTSNIASYMAHKEVDGGLVGGASLKADDFYMLIQAGIQGR